MLSGFYCLRGFFRAADSKTKEQRKKENVLFRKEKETHHQKSAYGQQPGPHHSQIKPQERKNA